MRRTIGSAGPEMVAMEDGGGAPPHIAVRPRRTQDRALRAMAALSTTILVIAALAVAQPVFAPLTFALFIIAIVWPLQRALQAYLPKLLALALCIAVTVVVLALFAWLASWGFSGAGHYLITGAGRFQQIYTQLNQWLKGHGIVIASLWTEHFNVGWVLGVFQQITSRLNNLLTFTVVVLIYVILGLLEIDTVSRRLRKMTGNEAVRVFLDGFACTATKLRRYMLVRTLMSVVTGLLVWAIIQLCGLPLAREWGVIAFTLNYIPFIGSLVSTLLPALFACAQFAVWQDAILLFVGLQLVQFLVGSYLEPRVAGSILSMSPFLVLFSVFFWSFLWGIAGAFIGIPIVIAALTLCEQHPSSRWVAQICGAPVTAGE